MKPKSTQKSEEELAKTLAHTLDKSLAEIDDLSLQRLKNARADALSHSVNSANFSSRFIRFGIAASLITLVVVPILWHQYNAQQFSDADVELVLQEIPPAAQELDDMDMLIAMGDIDA